MTISKLLHSHPLHLATAIFAKVAIYTTTQISGIAAIATLAVAAPHKSEKNSHFNMNLSMEVLL